MTRRLFSVLKLLLLGTVLSGTTGSVTLLITGHDTENVQKHNLASLFVYSYDEIIKESPSDLHVFTNSIKMPPVIEHNHLFSVWSNYGLSTNLTTLIVTNIGIDQMDLDQLDIVRRFITNDSALIAIEIGKPKIETRALLEGHSSCLKRGYALIASPNIVYFCNNASPEMLSNLSFAKPLNMKPSEHRDVRKEPQQWLIWPNLFASAAKLEGRTHQGHKQEHHHHHHHSHTHSHHPHHSHHNHKRNFEEDVEEIVDMIMEDIVEQGEISEASANTPVVKERSKRDKKKACKYRKSCYETGIKPVITDNSIINYFHWWPEKNEGDEDKEDKMKPYNASEDLTLQKLQCKYRHSCYHEFGIPFKEKSADEEKKKPIRSYKAVPLQHGKKKTLKEIAAEVLKMVEESAKKAVKRPLVNTMEKHMTALEEKLSEKLNCKYRKSCYETGEIPHIEEKWSLPLPIKIFSTESVDSENNQINFDELAQLEKKLYCKYRKSCYETGVKPDIEPEIFIGSLKDLTTIHEQVETRKLSLQEKCKYRKSCYESGIVPEINPKLEVAISKEVSSVIPTNPQELKLLCKYRKSCYAKVYDSATVDTIKLIRKRHQIEKEVRRRKGGRAKHHRKLYGEMQLEHYRKVTTKKAPDENVEYGRSLKASKISDKKKTRQQIDDINKEVGEIKERSDGEEKQGKVKKSKQEVEKEPAIPITTKPKETTPAKKDRKGKKMKLEKQTPLSTLTAESTEELYESESAKKEAKSTTSKPLKTGLEEMNKERAKEEQDTPEVITGDEKKGKGLGKAVQKMNKLIEEMHHQQEQQQRKEFCKYRKSCYETGKKPEIKQSLHNLLTMFKEHVDRETGEVHVKPKTEVEKKLDCKYRKSCYKNDLYSRKHEVTNEVKDKLSATKFSHGTYEQENAKEDIKSDYDARIATKESLTYTEQQMKYDSMKRIGLERYKKSGKCNPYYYSCRAILGLPPKERAPIGPNGRRLCRKKPSSSA